MKLEVLVATMNQEDTLLYKKMNIGCDALIANQNGQWKYEEINNEKQLIRFISSDTKGVGINRNLGLQLAKGDIILFADDDIVYNDSTLEKVIDAFENNPKADVIFFGIEYTKDGKVIETRINENKRLHLFNSLKYGACRMAIRRQSLIKNNLSFSTLFGGGALYGSGEDSLFIRRCFKNGLKVYSDSYILGKCAKDSSTWFTGFNEKYLFDKGAWICCAFPKLKHIVKWYFSWRFSKKSGFSINQSKNYINKGIRAFNKLETYESYCEENQYEKN